MNKFYRDRSRTALVLAGGLFLAYWVGSLLTPAPKNGRVANSALEAASPGHCSPSGSGADLSPVCPSDNQQPEALPQEMTTLKHEVTLLGREVSSLRRQILEQKRASTAATAEKEEDPASDPRLNPAAQAAAEQARQEQMAAIEAGFQREPIDRKWAFKTTSAVQEVLASDEVGQTALRSLECRSHTCRVEMTEDETGQLAKSLPLLLQQLPPTLASVTANNVTDGSGSRMILYLSGDEGEFAQNDK